MSRQWTEQQYNAIYATDGSVLVSAAAGSGKTAVLVERVIKLITREENPIDVDRLLIVTFTRAAAAEMRQRLSSAINSLLENDPYNARLLRQKQLLYNASISTIDSFCGDLVREYFHTLDIARDFRIADEGELKVLRKTALDTTLEVFYKQHDEVFYSLINNISTKNSDEKVRKMVLKISDFLSTQPFPELWLDNMLDNYKPQNISDTIWGKIVLEYSLSALEHAIILSENSIIIAKSDDKLFESVKPCLDDDILKLNDLLKIVSEENFDDAQLNFSKLKFSRLATPKGYGDNPLKESISANRKEIKDIVDKLKKYFYYDNSLFGSEIKLLQLYIGKLFDVVREYISEFDKLKAKKNILSFSDIELLTVKLLAEPNEDGYYKTIQADEISARYDAVMVDEFQDVNDVQDLIFRCVSKDESNLFVVGDVKQSIYGFRQAKPEIFINRKNAYNRFNRDNPDYPATIILDKNFRSRSEVCDAVNFIFSRLMSKGSAQMDYDEDEMLVNGAIYPDSSDCDFEITLIERTSFEDVEPAQVEAQYIANKIHKMMGEGFLVSEGANQRKATFGDFAILLRSPSKTASIYVNTLINNGIPAFSENKENFFDVQEVKIMLNLLRIIDNPTLDIPMLSVMCSPIYSFTPDELAQIRANSRYTNLYTSVVNFAQHSKKASDFVNELNRLRKFAYTCGIDELIGRVYEETSFVAITSAVKGTGNSSANLNILREYARNYETNGYKTLTDFISFIDRLVENGTSLPASTTGEGDLNGVRVLSIHASKGLEYPVCFIADSAHQFNKTDLKEDVLIDSHTGVGIMIKENDCKTDTFTRLAVGLDIAKNEVAEELRVLYVALTRAREKLIVVSSLKDVEKQLTRLYQKLSYDNTIDSYTVTKAKSISDWILLCALTHPSLNNVRRQLDPEAKNIFYNNESEWVLNIIDSLDVDDTVPSVDAEEIINSTSSYLTDYAELLKRNLSFEYVNAQTMFLPQNVSASHLTHNDKSYFDTILNKPLFIKSDSVTAVERGTAHHRFLQHCNFVSARENIGSEIERLKSDGVLTDAQAESIDIPRILKLLKSQLFDRIIKSSQILREEQFFVKLSPSLLFDEFKDIETDKNVVVQGAVDLAFLEDGQLVIVDYKTDRVKEIEKLAELYAKQLEIYRYAMEQSTEIKVKECIICSVHLDEFISL